MVGDALVDLAIFCPRDGLVERRKEKYDDADERCREDNDNDSDNDNDNDNNILFPSDWPCRTIIKSLGLPIIAAADVKLMMLGTWAVERNDGENDVGQLQHDPPVPGVLLINKLP